MQDGEDDRPDEEPEGDGGDNNVGTLTQTWLEGLDMIARTRLDGLDHEYRRRLSELEHWVVSFGVGLFDPGQLVTLRYDVSESVSVEAVTSDETTRAGIDYRMTLRSPWSRIYGDTLSSPNHGLFSVVRTAENRALFKWVGPLAHQHGIRLRRGPGMAVRHAGGQDRPR